jgi:glucose-1-phosphate adenylyltransferase
VVPPDTTIGVDPDHDRKRGFMVTESGLTVIAKFQEVTA